MIGSAFRVGFLTLIGLVLTWASFLLFPSFSEQLLAAEQAGYARAFPSEEEQGPAGRFGDKESFSMRAASHVLGHSIAFSSAAHVVNRRLGVALRFVPFVFLAFGVSLVAGLVLRERLRLGSSYASPSVSFLAKRLAEGAFLVFFVWSFSPLPLPYWALYPLLGGLTIGATTYVANLPLRL
jgi:hypothetical protein